MRAASLFGVLLLARVLMLAGAPIPISLWTPFAYVWQDVAAALVFAALDHSIARPRWVWVLYGAAVAYLAVNVPIALALSSPLTWTMMRAVGGPLADSVRHHATSENVAPIVLIGISGFVFLVLLKRARFQVRRSWLVVPIAVVALGPFAVTRIETLGFHRNAFGALWPAGAGYDVYDRPGAHTAPHTFGSVRLIKEKPVRTSRTFEVRLPGATLFSSFSSRQPRLTFGRTGPRKTQCQT